MRVKSDFLFLLLALPFCLASCSDSKLIESNAKSDNPIENRFPATPELGEAVFYPPTPVIRTSAANNDENLLRDPGFEAGLGYWRVSGTTPEECHRFERFAAYGELCCQALAAAPGSVFVYQDTKLAPVSFYSFSALVYAPGPTTVRPEALHDAIRWTVKGQEFTGPAPAWKKLTMSFVTPRALDSLDSIAVGVRCLHDRQNMPVLIDQCILRSFPSNNLLSNGTAETPPKEEDTMPEWYLNGKAASPASSGFKSKQAFELPPHGNSPSRLFCFISSDEKIYGRTVWISAMTKISRQRIAPPPRVTVGLRLAGASVQDPSLTVACPFTGDWAEVNLLAKVPEAPEGTDPPYLPVLVFERPAGLKGSAVIDEVSVVPVPEGFAGALSLPS